MRALFWCVLGSVTLWGCTPKRPVRVLAATHLDTSLLEELQKRLAPRELIWEPFNANEFEKQIEMQRIVGPKDGYDVIVGGLEPWHQKLFRDGVIFPPSDESITTNPDFLPVLKLSNRPCDPVFFTVFGFFYNPKLIGKSKIPKGLGEVLLKSRFSLIDPEASNLAEQALFTLFEHLPSGVSPENLSQLDVLWEPSYHSALKRVESGERDFSFLSYQYQISSPEFGSSTKLLHLREGFPALISCISIVKSTPYLDAARTIRNFVLTSQFQSFVTKERTVYPVIQGVPIPSSMEKLDKILGSLVRPSDKWQKMTPAQRRRFIK